MIFDNNSAIIVVTIFFASLIRTATGFGFAILAIPILSFILEPSEAVAYTMIFQTLSAIPIALLNTTMQEWKYASKLIFFSLVGLLPGVFFLIVLPSIIVQLLVAICILIALVIIFTGVQFKAPFSFFKWILVGFSVGFMHGLAGVSGPPILATLHADQTLSKSRKRKVMAIFFLFAGVFSLIPIIIHFPIVVNDINFLAILFLSMVVGMSIGQKIFIAMSEVQFRICSTFLISISFLLAITQIFNFAFNI